MNHANSKSMHRWHKRNDCLPRFNGAPGLRWDEIARLQEQSDVFLQFWNAQELVAREGGVRTFMHPIVGRLLFKQMTLQLQGRPDLRLTILVEAPE
jgi:hypothetical protein